jgi:LysM domain-containing protein
MEDSMSAAVAWDLTSGGRAARPRLQLVPTGPDVRPSHLRLNRRGRLAVTVVVLAAVLTLTVVLAAGSGAAEPVVQRTATVSAGQTLSEVAAERLPDLPIAEGVARLQLVNHLASTQIHAGQTLLLPAAG